MSMSENHIITLWACGHVQSQCRCPGPKVKHTLADSCPACKEASAAQESYRSSREIARLASYLMAQHGGPVGSESAVDMAIRLLDIKADLERTLASAQRGLNTAREELAIVHELHGTALQALGALTAALAPNLRELRDLRSALGAAWWALELRWTRPTRCASRAA